MGRNGATSLVKTAGLWLALAAMVLRLALPAGFMPSTSISAPIMLCTPSGMLRMAAPDDGNQKSDPGKADHQDNCPFGAAPHLATLASLALLAVPELRLLYKTDPPLRQQAFRNLYAPQIPRGPPLAV